LSPSHFSRLGGHSLAQLTTAVDRLLSR